MFNGNWRRTMTDIALGHVTANLNLPQSGSTVPVPVDAVQSVTFTPTTLEMNDAGQAVNNPFQADFVSGQLTYNGQTGVHLYPGSWTVTFIPSLNHAPIDLFVTPGAEINLFDWNDNSNVIVPTKDAADGDLLDWDGEKPAWITPTGIKGIGTAAFQNISAFATAAQGSKADTALQEANYDAVKQAADDAKASAAQSAADALNAKNTVAAFSLTASATQVAAGGAPTASVTGSMPNLSLSLGIPVGQPTYELRGSGSPYNSVTPPGSGYYYTDIAGTCGAWRWMSTGTRKTSWIVVRGDTGWRSISADSSYGFVAAGNFFGAVNGAALTGNELKIRRINEIIYITSEDVVQPKQNFSTTTNKLFVCPVGFDADYKSSYSVMRYGNNKNDPNQRLIFGVAPDTSGAWMKLAPLIDSNWNNLPTSTTWPQMYGGIWITGQWICPKTWPTTLPGTAST